jgi:PelA/Pel-15E family pectate lyase
MPHLLLLFILSASAICAEKAAPVSVSMFFDNIHHYQALADSKTYPRFKETQWTDIADNILLMQRDNGGWASNWDPLRVIPPEEISVHQDRKAAKDTTFDNRSTYTHMLYLSEVYKRTAEERFRAGAEKALQFILDAQYENGGWPHSYPQKEGYLSRITIMDDVMVGVLSALRKVCSEESSVSFLDDALRLRAEKAWQCGHRCLLDLQVRVDGMPTVWAGQYDERTLEPAAGRSFELPGLVSLESATVVHYLMKEAPQTEETVYAVECAIDWFKKSQINGLRIDRIDCEPVQYKYRVSRKDVVAVPDPEAPPLWARFYEIGTNRPFMANRDGTKVYSIEELEHERRSGYAWYGTGPALLLEEYASWKKPQTICSEARECVEN